MKLSEKWETAILAVWEFGLAAWFCFENTISAGKMPAVRDRLEASPPFFQTELGHFSII